MAEQTGTKKKHSGLVVESDPEVATGVYSNLMLVSHRKEEFVLDFLFVEPQAAAGTKSTARLRARAITSPEHVKRIVRALEENIRRYEQHFGAIEAATDLPKVIH